jgi:hypothetical protein
MRLAVRQNRFGACGLPPPSTVIPKSGWQFAKAPCATIRLKLLTSRPPPGSPRPNPRATPAAGRIASAGCGSHPALQDRLSRHVVLTTAARRIVRDHRADEDVHRSAIFSTNPTVASPGNIARGYAFQEQTLQCFGGSARARGLWGARFMFAEIANKCDVAHAYFFRHAAHFPMVVQARLPSV